MKVSELVDILQQMDQDATVTVLGGSDSYYGDFYSSVEEVRQESVGWDDDNQRQIMEVFIL